VPAGSVGFAAGQCGIYPRQSPGGWRILGKTSAPIFDPENASPALFRPGDRVRFNPVATLEDARANVTS
jgi:allophanate hydrolase subunit 1